MFDFLNRRLSPERIEAIERKVVAAAESDGPKAAWAALQPLLRAQPHHRDAALALVRLVDRRCLPHERGLEVLVRVQEAHDSDDRILAEIGCALEGARDIDDLNAAPPEDPLFDRIVERLSKLAADARGQTSEPWLLYGLSTAARLMARQRDEIAERAYRRLVELDAERSSHHYGLGLFLKTRGRFQEGMAANQTAASLEREPRESTAWNLGICATGARAGSVALEVWKGMGQKIELGRFDLPEGSYHQCKVRIAQRPLAERSKEEDDPGLEETIWVERLSPCHGIVRSVLFQDLGVDFGDVVLFDGAPVTFHRYGETSVPVFPHLATLVRNGYQLYDFAGTQDRAGHLETCTEDLERDAIVYSHTEGFQLLCASCWRNPDLDHAEHVATERHVVRGRIAAPPDLEPSELLRQLDRAVADRTPCSIYAPELCRDAGQPERAEVERRRFEMLVSN